MKNDRMLVCPDCYKGYELLTIGLIHRDPNRLVECPKCARMVPQGSMIYTRFVKAAKEKA